MNFRKTIEDQQGCINFAANPSYFIPWLFLVEEQFSDAGVANVMKPTFLLPPITPAVARIKQHLQHMEESVEFTTS